jgi:chromosome segregation ATPase
MDLKFLDPYRWLIAGVVAASLIGGYFYWRSSLIAEGREQQKTETAKQALKQIERAQDQTRQWKDQANEFDVANQELEAANEKLRSRNAAGAGRLRDTAPSAIDMAGASTEACRSNATEAEHDLGECAVRYSALGDTASDAAAKAWELYEKWPEYQEFQSKLTTFTNQLKGTK